MGTLGAKHAVGGVIFYQKGQREGRVMNYRAIVFVGFFWYSTLKIMPHL